MKVVGRPLCIEWLEGVREEGKEDKEACRLRLLLELTFVPLVADRYRETEAMMLVEYAGKQ